MVKGDTCRLHLFAVEGAGGDNRLVRAPFQLQRNRQCRVQIAQRAKSRQNDARYCRLSPALTAYSAQPRR